MTSRILKTAALAALALAALACNGDAGPTPTPAETGRTPSPSPSDDTPTPRLTPAPAAKGWRTLAPMPTPRSEVAVAEFGGKIYVIGGFEGDGASSAKVEVYDPETDTWGQAPSLPEPRHHAAAVSYSFGTLGSRLLVIGGFGIAFNDPKSDVFEYTEEDGRWSENPPMLTARGAHAATLYDNHPVAIGGVGVTSGDQTGNLSSVERMALPSREWSERGESLNVARDHLGAASVMVFQTGAGFEQLHAIGGRSDLQFSRNLDTNESATSGGQWRERSRLPTARSGIAAVSFRLRGSGPRIYVFGGESPEGTFDVVEVYDPDQDVWTTGPSMPTARHGLGAAVVGDTIYVIGGGERPGLSVSGANEAFTP